MNRSAVLLLLCSSLGYAATVVSGDLRTVSFTRAGNPYVVEKDVTVPPRGHTCIPAGTVLLFRPFTGLAVEGTLTVEGTAEAPVVFTSVNDTACGPATGQLANAFDWNGVQVAQNGRLTASNLQLRYSVYGVDSRSDSVALKDALFCQNGQGHLSIGDRIQPVRDNLPYSCNWSAPAASAQPSVGRVEPATSPKSGRRAWRIASLAAAAAGAGLGVYFATQSAGWHDRRDAIDPAAAASTDAARGEWQDADDKRSANLAGSIVSFGVGAAFLVGFGVSFAF